MASPRRFAAKLKPVSPRLLENTARQFLNPRTPVKRIASNKDENKNLLSPFNIDTPNRIKILENGLPKKHGNVLGSGGFGTVYKASYKGNDVATKIMQKTKCTNTIMNSEKHAYSLSHPNIVKVLTIEEGTSLSLITMELCGITLQDKLNEVALDCNQRVSTLRDVTCALQFCHNAGLIHMDIKPTNILFAADGRPKLTDFGSSTLITEVYENTGPRGTPGYVAPEVLKGNKPTPAADIYSLGVVAWQMLSRKLPFAGLHAHTIIYLTANGNHPKDDNLDDALNGKYKNLYQKMWSQNNEYRPTANEIINIIHTLLQL